MTKRYFRFYPEYLIILKKVNVFERYKILEAMANYVQAGMLPEKLKPKSQMIFNSIKPIIDGDIEYQKLCEERKYYGTKGAKKRWKNPQNSKK